MKKQFWYSVVLAIAATSIVSSIAFAAVRYVRSTGDFMTGMLTVDVASTGNNAVMLGAGDYLSLGTSGSFPSSGIRGGTQWGSTGIQTSSMIDMLAMRSQGIATASIPAASASSAGLLIRSTTDDYPYWNTASATKKLAYFSDVPVISGTLTESLDGYSGTSASDNTIYAAGAFISGSCSKTLMTCCSVITGTVAAAVATYNLYDLTTATSKGSITSDCALAAGDCVYADIGPITYTTLDILALRISGCTSKPLVNCHVTCTH